MSVMKDSLVVFKEGAKVNFAAYGYVTPIFAGELDGEPQIFPIAWNSVADKETFARKVLDWIANGRLKEYIMVMEAWKAEADSIEQVQEWLREHGSLEHWSGRTEVVMVLYCSDQEEIECTANIIRGIISPLLGEWTTTSRKVRFNHLDFSSRFQGLFLKARTGQN
jgi:hypothetical protein